MAYRVTTDRSELDVELIHRFLSEDSYWSARIPRDVLQRALDHSLCFGVFDGDRQVGFARAVTDRATFAYLADVFILPSHRGRGLSKMLMQAIRDHPDLQRLRRWHLITRDAHGLYSQFGFEPLTTPERHMQIANVHVYDRPS